MKYTLIGLFLSINLLTQTTLAQSCPSGITNDPYPGKCGLYTDKNTNNNCDLGETSTNNTENHTQTDAGSQSNNTIGNTTTETTFITNTQIILQQMHFGLFLGFLILLIVIFLIRNIKAPIFNKIRSIDANIRLIYIPILGLIQYFFFPKILSEPIHRGYLGFRSLRFILIIRPLANITNKYIKKSILNTFFIWCVGKRKQIGITMFWFAFLHGIIWIINRLNRNMLIDNLFLSLLGIFGLLGLFSAGIGFITSNKKAIKYLGKNRKKIQKISYITMIAATVHIYFVNTQRGLIVIGLMITRIFLRFLARKK